jgi:hypothetical protein
MKKFLMMLVIIFIITGSVSVLIFSNIPSGGELEYVKSTKVLPKLTAAITQENDVNLKDTFIKLLCLMILIPIGYYLVNLLKLHYGMKKDD